MAGGLAAAGSAIKTIGPVIGAAGQIEDINKGLSDYTQQTNRANEVMTSGKNDALSAYSPYTATGSQGTTNAAAGIADRQQAYQPQLSNVQASDTNAYLNPSSNYSQDQARKQATAAGAGSGAMGGGMMRALSNNAVGQSSTNWNNAYQQMLDAKKTNFGQQQQQYTNTNGYQQQQIENNMGLASTGLQAVGGGQNLASVYNTKINENLGNLGATQMGAWGKKGQIFNDAAGETSENVGNFMGQAGGMMGS